jgi:single-stranded-DNA-specific exonuclease
MSYSIRRVLTPNEKNALSGVPDLTAHLLFHRGIADAETAGRFLAPDYERDTHDPFLLKDAEKAASRIIQGLISSEKMAIYADYDADGIPGAAMWNDFFKRIGFKNFVIYIPHRHNEGFGLNAGAVEELAGQGVKLVITVDCGITDSLAVKRANELGLQVIITDHHEAPVSSETGHEELPSAFAIVDHKQSGCEYPDKDLCGTGVAYKLIQAIIKKSKENNELSSIFAAASFKEGHEKWLLDLVGMATLSDMVPLTGENRVFAHYGLTVLRKSPRKGLRQLLSRLRIAQEYVTEDDIAFMITPRINAASRMGVPMDAFDLLAADTDEAGAVAAAHLDEINNERKGVVASLVKEVKKIIKERYGEIPNVIVLGNPEWRPSLLGLAANSCAEEFHRPVFLWGRDGDDTIKGSCRSEGKTHVVELMRAMPKGTLTQFGGHHHSGGFTVSNEAVHYLEQRLNEAAEKLAKEAELLKRRGLFERAEIARTRQRQFGEAEAPSGQQSREASSAGNEEAAASEASFIDAELQLSQITYRLHDEINKLAPFGIGNRKPVFLFKSVTPASVRRFGKGNEHIELSFESGGNKKVSAISFFGVNNEWADKVKAGQPLDLIASVEKSMFRGRPELRLRVVDIISK